MNTCRDCRKRIVFEPGHGTDEVQALMIRCQPCAAKRVAGKSDLAWLKYQQRRMEQLRQP